MLQTITTYLSHATIVELGALFFGITYVLLAARGNTWCWPAGILASVLSLVIAMRSNYRLDAIKETYYIAMGIYGWYVWTQQTGEEQTRPVVSNTPGFNLRLIIVAGVISLLIGYYFSTLGSSLPYLDAATTVFAFTTTWLVARKVLENWLYWIVINIVSIYMYVQSEFYFFSILLSVYTAVAIAGFFRWRKLQQDQSNGAVSATSSATA